jgi:hypothetical protein
LKRHINKIHIQIECPFINCSSETNSENEDFEMESDNDVKFCHYCSNVYKTEASLKAHIALIHEGKKTFQCFICQGSFDTRLKLQSHDEEFHDEKSYELASTPAVFEENNFLGNDFDHDMRNLTNEIIFFKNCWSTCQFIGFFVMKFFIMAL